VPALVQELAQVQEQVQVPLFHKRNLTETEGLLPLQLLNILTSSNHLV
jgi:hypothetical protein